MAYDYKLVECTAMSFCHLCEQLNPNRRHPAQGAALLLPCTHGWLHTTAPSGQSCPPRYIDVISRFTYIRLPTTMAYGNIHPSSLHRHHPARVEVLPLPRAHIRLPTTTASSNIPRIDIDIIPRK